MCFQSIPADMDFDPNSNPPCYKTKDEVCKKSKGVSEEVELFKLMV